MTRNRCKMCPPQKDTNRLPHFETKVALEEHKRKVHGPFPTVAA